MNHKITSLWPRKAAVILSDSPHLLMFLKELLRSEGWTIVKAATSVAELLETLLLKQAFFVIIDDTVEMPAMAMLRELLRHPVALATPTISFILEEHISDYKTLAALGEPEIASKPLTPSRFAPSFVQTIRRWETKPYVALRSGMFQLLRGEQVSERLAILHKLSAIPAIQHLVAPALALQFRAAGKLQEAEQVLLQQLRATPRNLACVLTLVDLYLHAAMPDHAKRLLVGAQRIFEGSSAMLPDLVQAEMMRGHFDEAIGAIEQMLQRRYWLDQATPFLARLLHALGRSKQAGVVMRERKGLYKKIEDAWLIAS